MDIESVFTNESFPSKEKGPSVSVHQAEVALRLGTGLRAFVLSHAQLCIKLKSVLISRDAVRRRTHARTPGSKCIGLC